MKIETKFDVGQTVYFLGDEGIYRGVIGETVICVWPTHTVEEYEVEYTDGLYEKVRKRIDADSLFENAKGVVEKLMKDFEKSEEENEGKNTQEEKETW